MRPVCTATVIPGYRPYRPKSLPVIGMTPRRALLRPGLAHLAGSAREFIHLRLQSKSALNRRVDTTVASSITITV